MVDEATQLPLWVAWIHIRFARCRCRRSRTIQSLGLESSPQPTRLPADAGMDHLVSASSELVLSAQVPMVPVRFVIFENAGLKVLEATAPDPDGATQTG